MIATLAFVGHGKWYSIGNNVNAPRQINAASFDQPKRQALSFVNTGIELTAQQKAWCEQDADNNGRANKFDSALARQNCATGLIHKAQQ